MTKRLLLITLLIAACFQYALAANTYDFELDGMYYQCTSDSTITLSGINEDFFTNNVPVYAEPDSYLDVAIPSSVFFEGANYLVTAIADSVFCQDSFIAILIDDITVPSTVKTIGKESLKGGNRIKFLSLEPPLINGSLGGTILVNEAAYDSYKQSDGYSDCRVLCFDGHMPTIPADNVYNVYGYGSKWGISRGCVVIFNDCEENTSISVRYGYTHHGIWSGWVGNGGRTFVVTPDCLYSEEHYDMEIHTVTDDKYYSVSELMPFATLSCSDCNSYYDFSESAVYFSFSSPLSHNVSVASTELFEGQNGVVNQSYSGDVEIPQTAHFAIWDYDVVGINYGSFSYCADLNSVTIPATVQTIEDKFIGCPNLTKITCLGTTPPNSVEFDASIYQNVSLCVPDNALEAYRNAPSWCNFQNIVGVGFSPVIEFADQNVKAICVQNWDINGDGELSQDEAAAVTSLGNVFSGNDYITSFNELEYFTGLTSIDESAFADCSNLASLTLPISVTSIGDYAFYVCQELASLTLPSSLTYIGDFAFGYCLNNLSSITIPNSVTYIGDATFLACFNLMSVIIGNSVTHIGDDAFSECFGLNSIVVADDNMTYDSRGNCNAIIETSSNELILGCKNSIIPNSVKSIGKAAFADCYGLKRITIPSGVTTIGEEAFHNCASLTSITIPTSVTNIGDYAFSGCSSLPSLVIPNSITNIGDYAFLNCLELMSVYSYINNPNLITMGLDVFKITDYEVPVANIYDDRTLYVPSDSRDEYLDDYRWGQFFNWIMPLWIDYDFEQDGLYYKITNNGEVSLTTGPQPYSGSVMVPAEVTFDGVTYTVTGIANGTFANAELSNLYLPVTIGNIGDGAFVGCNIQSLYITGAGSWQACALNLQVNNLFIDSGVTGLAGMQIDASSIYCYATVPPACDDQTFQSYNADLHVPASSLAAYFTAPYWCNLLNIIGDAVELTEFTLSDSSLEMPVGGQATLRATIKPTNATAAEVTWSSGNDAVAIVTGGVVTGIAAGECDIFAISQSQRAVCHVVVYDIPPTGITISQETAKMEMGTQLTLTATVLPEDATDKTVTWLSDNEAVATVADGVVTAVGTGECNITANCGELQATCHVIVVEHLISITLDEHEISILPNHIIILTPTISPVSTDLVVTSTNPNVAAVRLAGNKIQVVGIAEGTTTIYVNSADGYAEGDSCEVTVITEIGDVNNDGFVDINDVTTLIDRVLGKNQPLNSENADVNYDGNIDINDVTDLIGAVLGTSQLVPKDKNTMPITVNGVTFKMVRVNGGTFTMGATAEQGGDALEWENPAHQVTLSDYAIGQTEVTQALWEAVMGSNPSLFTSDPNRPVERVTWDECQEFITRLNALTGKRFRLPTEAEWEFAARGGNKSQGYKYAGSNNIDEVAWYLDNSYAVGSGSPDFGTHIVRTQRANELGLYDMSGNVWEWCQDYFGDYGSEAQFNPTGPETGTNRMRRGGGWDLENASCRVSHRSNRVPTYKYNNQGLRLVLDVVDVYSVNGVSFTMVPVKGGTFTMGATAEQGDDALEWEYPTHQVTLSDYAIGQTEVTQALWEAVMGSNPSMFTSDPNRPVERVTWDECQEFITRLNALTGKRFRLPTEAEWEFAARGGNKSQGYKYAGSNNIDEVAWYLDNSYAVGSGSPDFGTHIVGTQKANELCLYDISGNVWEWCQDYYGDYGSEAQFNPTGPETGTNRMRRGGGWDLENASCRVSHRSNRVSTYKYNNQGLRLAL